MLNGRAVITGPIRLGEGDCFALGSASLGFRLQKPEAAQVTASDPAAMIGPSWAVIAWNHLSARR